MRNKNFLVAHGACLPEQQIQFIALSEDSDGMPKHLVIEPAKEKGVEHKAYLANVSDYLSPLWFTSVMTGQADAYEVLRTLWDEDSTRIKPLVVSQHTGTEMTFIVDQFRCSDRTRITGYKYTLNLTDKPMPYADKIGLFAF